MEYREIVAVTGIGGLFQLLTTKSDGAIVRNLADKSTKFIPARIHNVTPIESIEIYTVEDNVRLHIVFQAMKDQESTTPIASSKASNSDIKAYFQTVFPSMDEDRVYVSDMKKILKWYELLKANELLNFEMLQQEEVAEEVVEEESVSTKTKAKKAEANSDNEEKPAKKAKTKKATVEATTEEAPAKKTARKKKTEE